MKYWVTRDSSSHVIELTFSSPIPRREDSERGSLATLFGHLVSLLWSQTDTREVLTLFREQIGLRCPTYRSADQQDSHEFLMSLLTVLHEDLNEAVSDIPLLLETFMRCALRGEDGCNIAMCNGADSDPDAVFVSSRKATLRPPPMTPTLS